MRKLLILLLALLFAAGCTPAAAPSSSPALTAAPADVTPSPAAAPSPAASRTPKEACYTWETVPEASFSPEILQQANAMPPASGENLPYFCGFNLQNMYKQDSENSAFQEDTLRTLSDWGFNFVRIPLDYRILLYRGDFDQIRESQLKRIDQLLEWAAKYGIHVNLCLHRAPGYTISRSAEPESLWESPEMKTRFTQLWTALARRYAALPSSLLSFDLVNEPTGVSEKSYLSVMNSAIDAIRSVSPERLLFVDMLDAATTPLETLRDPRIVQSFHQYRPMSLTHYQADWIDGSDSLAPPAWPPNAIPSYLRRGQNSLTLQGPFSEGQLTCQLVRGSDSPTLALLADGKTIWQQTFSCAKDAPGVKASEYKAEYGIWQADFTTTLTLSVPTCQTLQLKVIAGDWLRFGAITLTQPDGKTAAIQGAGDWEGVIPTLALRDGAFCDAATGPLTGPAWLEKNVFNEYITFSQKNSLSLHAGEWGVYRATDSETTLRFMEDTLRLFQKNHIGWALWDLDGGFGPVDSTRPGAHMEWKDGLYVDTEMLSLLQTYASPPA